MVRMTVLAVPAIDGELAADRLWLAGARAVEERSIDGDRVEVCSALGSDDEVSLARLGGLPEHWGVDFVDVDDAPEATWREFATAVEVGERVVIRPAWQAPLDRPGTIEVAIEPGGAFGLGDHPTTRLSAAAVSRLVSPGARVLDVGCGTGVLAVLAARLGAGSVVAIDVAEAAKEATRDNADRNGVGDRIDASTTALTDVAGEYDVVLANILAPVLVSLAPDLRRVTAPGGRLVIAGVLADRFDHVLAALAPMRPVRTEEIDGWAGVELADP
jgi:ribosomal protein L11 methyltransferase